jgi:hypothetical protein
MLDDWHPVTINNIPGLPMPFKPKQDKKEF